MGSSLPNHDAKDQKDRHKRNREKKKQKKKQEKQKPRADCKLAQKYIENNNQYDAWIISTHDSSSNAVRISSIAL